MGLEEGHHDTTGRAMGKQQAESHIKFKKWTVTKYYKLMLTYVFLTDKI